MILVILEGVLRVFGRHRHSNGEAAAEASARDEEVLAHANGALDRAARREDRATRMLKEYERAEPPRRSR